MVDLHHELTVNAVLVVLRWRDLVFFGSMATACVYLVIARLESVGVVGHLWLMRGFWGGAACACAANGSEQVRPHAGGH